MPALPSVLLFAIAGFVFASAGAAAETGKEIDLLAGYPGTGATEWIVFGEGGAEAAAATWRVEEGVLRCAGTPLGYLHTKGDFANFVLRLEWRWPKQPGRGGVLIRTTGPDKIWPKSLEAQINAGDAGDFWGLVGFALDGPAERKKTMDNPQFGRLTNLAKQAPLERKAGEWNEYEIRAEGDTVTLSVNGQEVNRATGCETTPGKICLTAEGDPIEFRNVRLTTLE